MTIRVLIVDDHRMVREGLRVFLGCDPELVIVGGRQMGLGRSKRPGISVQMLC